MPTRLHPADVGLVFTLYTTVGRLGVTAFPLADAPLSRATATRAACSIPAR